MKEGVSTFGGNAEGGDRASLHLNPEDVELIHAVAATNPRTIVVVVAAGAVLMDEWVDEPAAVMMAGIPAWRVGMRLPTSLPARSTRPDGCRMQSRDRNTICPHSTVRRPVCGTRAGMANG